MRADHLLLLANSWLTKQVRFLASGAPVPARVPGSPCSGLQPGRGIAECAVGD